MAQAFEIAFEAALGCGVYDVARAPAHRGYRTKTDDAGFGLSAKAWQQIRGQRRDDGQIDIDQRQNASRVELTQIVTPRGADRKVQGVDVRMRRCRLRYMVDT